MPQRPAQTKPKRPQKRRDIHTLLGRHPIWAGVGTAVFLTLLGCGISRILDDPHNGVLFILLGFIISLPLFLQAYRLYTHRKTDRKARIVITSLVLVGVALIVTQLQFTQARPRLRIDFGSSSVVASTGELKFRVVNSGQSAAYEYHPIIFAASADKPEKVIITSKAPGTNSVEPGESIYFLADIPEPNEVTGVWYLYLRLVYSSSPTGGRIYIDDSPYWLSYDFDNLDNEFVELTPTQRDMFKATIVACYPYPIIDMK